ncbi:MAG: hypothetical protein K2W96_11375 [Gemmataceae bacterium]|nr:hypothetical protein [Gemmataceae bacterium]
MTHHGPRPRPPFPDSLAGYGLRRDGGRIYAVPPHLELGALRAARRLDDHPDVLRAASLAEIEALIGQDDPAEPSPEGACEGWSLWRRGGRWHAVPPGTAPDLAVAEDRERAGVLSAPTRDELEDRLRALLADRPVEFAGWLPIYEVAGNCGRHPQFAHIGQPPEGFRFTRSGQSPAPTLPPEPSWWRKLPGRMLGAAWGAIRPLFTLLGGAPGLGLSGRWRLVRAMMRLWSACRRNGAGMGATLRFLQSRHLRSQMLLGRHPGPVFLTSMPYTFGQWPWLVEIEDPTTLFFPFVQNGHTQELDLRASPWFPCVKALLEDDACRGIVTHIRSTAELVKELFRSDAISRKVSYAPMGVKVPARYQRHEPLPDDAPLDLLFINSWHQGPGNFYLRGGLDVLEAFAVLKARYPRLRLTIRSALPPLDARYRRMIESGWVRVIDRFLSAEEMAALLAGSHAFLLPAARIHIVSLLQAMGIHTLRQAREAAQKTYYARLKY